MFDKNYTITRKMVWDADILRVADLAKEVSERINEETEAEVLRHFDLDFTELREFINMKRAGTLPLWVSVSERLPDENKPVLVYDGDIHIAKLEKGISVEERASMRRGELPDPLETGWTPSRGIFYIRRSESYKRCDEWSNNIRPYCWNTNHGTMFGQNVKFWMPLPEPPKEEEDET